MAGAMVSARLSPSLKEMGNRVLESLGSNASEAIKGLYEYLVEHGSLPWEDAATARPDVDAERLREAMDWVEGLQVNLSSEFSSMSIRDARLRRLGIGGDSA